MTLNDVDCKIAIRVGQRLFSQYFKGGSSVKLFYRIIYHLKMLLKGYKSFAIMDRLLHEKTLPMALATFLCLRFGDIFPFPYFLFLGAYIDLVQTICNLKDL